jgi:hypothetical protein
MSQQIAEIIPEAVSTQKGTLYDIHSNFKCNGNIVHINIDDYEGTYNVGDVLYCITDNILYKNYIYTLNVSATQQLHRIIMEQKNETMTLKHGAKVIK